MATVGVKWLTQATIQHDLVDLHAHPIGLQQYARYVFFDLPITVSYVTSVVRRLINYPYIRRLLVYGTGTNVVS